MSDAPSNKGKRRALVGLIVFIVLLALLMIRSLWRRDAVYWRSIGDAAGSMVATSTGFESDHLGIGVFRTERLLPVTRIRDAEKFVTSDPPGLHLDTGNASGDDSIIRKLGFRYERQLDERPESMRESLRLAIPTSLVIALLAVAPVRWAARVTKHRRAARVSSEGPGMKWGVIVGLACGILVGVTAMLLFRERPNTTSPPAAGMATASEASPKHPIVGTWQTNIEMIRATYRFDNDGKFTLTFDVPGARQPQNVTGTWRVEKSNRPGGTGEQIVMVNQTSSTPLSVVGEEESAPIWSLSGDHLVLKNLNRKRVEESITFSRVKPFVPGNQSGGDAAIIGTWKCPSYWLELKQSGELTMTTSQSERGGHWSLSGDTLTLIVERPPVRSAARRQADPSLSQPIETRYQVSWTADRNAFTIRPKDRPDGGGALSFHRLAPGEQVPRGAQLNSSRK